MEEYLKKIVEITEMWNDGLILDEGAIAMIVLAGAELHSQITVSEELRESL